MIQVLRALIGFPTHLELTLWLKKQKLSKNSSPTISNLGV